MIRLLSHREEISLCKGVDILGPDDGCPLLSPLQMQALVTPLVVSVAGNVFVEEQRKPRKCEQCNLATLEAGEVVTYYVVLMLLNLQQTL